MANKKFNETITTEERCIKIEHTYITKADKPFTIKMTAIIRNNDTLTILNGTGSNIWDFRSIDKDFFIALLQCFAKISQQEKLYIVEKE